jgi:hydrogenase maturation factor
MSDIFIDVVSYLQRRKSTNPFVDDEAEEVQVPLQQVPKDKTLEEELLEDSSESEGNADKPKEWEVEDTEGIKHTVSIKETKGKWIYMTTGVRIKAVEGESAEKTVQSYIDAGDEADLIE